MRRFVEVVEWFFRHLIAYPVLRLLFRNAYSDKTIELRSIKKILILRFDRIGDMIVTTPIFSILKQLHPDVKIGVFTSPANAEIIRHNRNIDSIYVLHRHWWGLLEEIRRARRERYDVVLNFIFNRTSSAGILANLVAPRGFKVGQGTDKYRFYFNRLLHLERTELHMAEVLAYFVEQVFGFTIPREQLRFELSVDQQSQTSVNLFLRKHRLQRRGGNAADRQLYIVFNISATDSARKINKEQVLGLTQHIVSSGRTSLVLIGAPLERRVLEVVHREVNSENCRLFPESGTASLLEIASLVEGAWCVISPDTSIIHFASAFQTPVLGFFTPQQMAHEWVPYNIHHTVVNAPAGMPVSAILLSEMTTQADRFMATLHQKEAVTS